MKLGTKLLMAPLLTAVVALAAGEINALLMSGEAADGQLQVQARMEQFKTLANTQTQLGQVHAGVYRTVALMASLDDAKTKALRGELAQQLGGAQRTLGASIEGSDADAQLRSGVSEAQGQIDKYLKAADSAIDLASVDPNTGVAAMQQADAAFDSLNKTVGSMVARIDALADESASASQARSRRNNIILTLVGLLAAGAAVFVAWRMQGKLVAELARAGEVANAVAGGDLSVETHSDRADEVGDLLRSLDRMASQLSESLRTVRESSQSIHTAQRRDRQRQPGPQHANRRGVLEPAEDFQLDGAADRHRAPERRERRHRQSTGQQCGASGAARRHGGGPGGLDHGRDQPQLQEDRRHHRRDRLDRLPDQYPRAERGPSKRHVPASRAAALRWWPAKCARSPSAQQRRPRRSRA